MEDWKNVTTWEAILPSSLLKAGNTLFIDNVESDGRPFIHAVLAASLKGTDTIPVLLLAFDKPVSEYIAVGRRLGHDLNLASIQNKFAAIDFVSSSVTARFTAMDALEFIKEKVLEVVKEKMQNLSRTGKELIVILDGVSLLPSLGISVSEVMRFVCELERVVKTLVIRSGIENATISRWLFNRSNTVFLVQPLTSGIRRQVHGQLLSVPGGSAFHNTPSFNSWLFKTTTESSLFIQPKTFDMNDFKLSI